jgi:TAG lipase/steryl ester hydrolase/phospholipase A2/LPA acyltransferase
MLFLIRTSLTRGLGGMGDLRLYKHSHIGTKSLIERYIESTKETIQSLLATLDKQSAIEPRFVLEQLLAARQSFGRSALLLSGGGTFGMNHIGVVKSLWEARLLPRIISGSSAGSIVCAVLCTKTDAEVPDVIDEFCYGDLAVFDKEGEEEGVLRKAARFLKYGSIFDISHLVRVMRNLLGEMTFQEAYYRTRRILNISVSSESIHEMPRLLNYITAPNVMIWSAVAASCSVPIIFSPAQLLAKDPRTGEEGPWNPSPQRWIDGSVDNDLPMTRLAEMFNVNHFIVSQVNPHVIPFLSREEEVIASQAENSTSAVAAGPGWLHTMADLAKGEALHRMQFLSELGIFPNYFTKAQSILSQKYSGDITILPEISYANFPRILKNPNTEFMLQAMLSGERATWPKLSRIQNHCSIELALDAAAQQLRSRIVFSPSQVDLRLNSMNTHTRGHHSGGEQRGRARNSRHPSSRSIEPKRPTFSSQRPRSYIDIKHKKTLTLRIPTTDRLRHDSSSPAVNFANTADLLSSSDADGHNGEDPFTEVEGDTTDSYSSESPPASPLPVLWPSTRQLFPSASQPTTPFASTRFPNLSSTSVNRPPTPGGSALLHPVSSSANFAMTPAIPPRTSSSSNTHLPIAVPSSPELRYKRLFHGAQKSAPVLSVEGDAVDDGIQYSENRRGRRDSESKRGNAAQSLVLDISGTRGMMLRRKRSMSTGAKGILPPGPR